METNRLYAGEELREITFDRKFRHRYAISNYGRFLSFKEAFGDGNFLKGAVSDGYKTFRYSYLENGKLVTKHYFFSKLVAQYFIPKTSEDQTYVLHLDYVRDNDVVRNLRWATRQEMLAHGKKSPHVILAKAKLWEKKTKPEARV